MILNNIRYLLYVVLVLIASFIAFVVMLNHSLISYERQIYIKSDESEAMVSIFIHGESGVISSGYNTSFPDTNYVVIKHRENMNMNHFIYICWDTKYYAWKAVVDRTQIIDNKLDTTRYKFQNMYERDENGIPSLAGFDAENCSGVGYIGPLTMGDYPISVKDKWFLRIGTNRYFR